MRYPPCLCWGFWLKILGHSGKQNIVEYATLTEEAKTESTLLGRECDHVEHPPPPKVQSLPLIRFWSVEHHQDGDSRVADEAQGAS